MLENVLYYKFDYLETNYWLLKQSSKLDYWLFHSYPSHPCVLAHQQAHGLAENVQVVSNVPDDRLDVVDACICKQEP